MPPRSSGTLSHVLWLLLVPLLVIAVGGLMRRRRKVVSISPSETLSTLHTERSRKTTKETKAALDAATRMLR